MTSKAFGFIPALFILLAGCSKEVSRPDRESTEIMPLNIGDFSMRAVALEAAIVEFEKFGLKFNLTNVISERTAISVEITKGIYSADDVLQMVFPLQVDYVYIRRGHVVTLVHVRNTPMAQAIFSIDGQMVDVLASSNQTVADIVRHLNDHWYRRWLDGDPVRVNSDGNLAISHHNEIVPSIVDMAELLLRNKVSSGFNNGSGFNNR